MPIQAKYTHTNLIAQNWEKLAHFYQHVFGCTPVLPERDLQGQWLDDATGLPNAHIRGVHMHLPGYGENGPTLEVFQYERQPAHPGTALNRPGFGHLAFAVTDVPAAREAVLAAGGHDLGKMVTLEIPDAGTITFIYMTDPEGNILELQRWEG